MVQNKALVFAEVFEILPEAGKHLQIHTSDFDEAALPPAGGFTGRVLFASFDPYLRHRLVDPKEPRLRFPPLPVGSVIPNEVLIRVLKADGAAGVVPGDVLIGMAPIQEYITVSSEETKQFSPVQNPLGLNLNLFLGPLGMSGLTGYAALTDIGQPKAGETIFVSAAVGAVGQIVGQLAKRQGLKVIGSAGSAEKVRILTEIFKFDGAFNYCDGDIYGQLKRLAPEGIDIYYDNVGGEQLDAALLSMNVYGRIVACGASSQYSVDQKKQYGLQNTAHVISNCVTWRGFSVFDPNLGGKFKQEHQENVGKWIKEGSLTPVLSETKGVDNAAHGLIALFEGKNVGKALLDFEVS